MGAQQDEATRALLRVAIGAFSLAALVGIVALLSGDFDETQARVAGTALAVSVYAVLAMPGFASTNALLGVLTVGASGIAFALVLGLLWFDIDDDGSIQAWASLSVIALCLSHATLLTSRLRDSDTEAVRTLNFATIASIGIVALLATALISGDGDGDGLAQALGVFAILDALGTILLPIVRRLGPAEPAPPQTAPVAQPAPPPAPVAGAARIRELPRAAFLEMPAGPSLLLAPTPMADGRLLAVVQDADGPTFLIEQPDG